MHRAVEPGATHPRVRAHGHPHLPCAETRSRVVGYLAHAPEAAPGYRTDGAWVWPSGLSGQTAEDGFGPQRQLLDHIQRNAYALPESVTEVAMAEAARQASGDPTPAEAAEVTYLVAPDSPRAPVLRRAAGMAGSIEAFTSRGWCRVPDAAQLASPSSGYSEASAAEVTPRLDELCALWHADQLAQAEESAAPREGVRLARMFDGTAPTGLPWFSPRRLRIIEPDRRSRIASYLSRGRLVIRSISGMADPLGSGSDVVVPLGFRTDGVWVWQEGLAHYVRSRGAAPELALLTHIESRAYRITATVTDEQVRSAVSAVRRGPLARPERASLTYFTDAAHSVLLRAPGGHLAEVEVLGPDLRWALPLTAVGGDLEEITEHEAVGLIDARWAALVGAAG